jgi:hypothetical protein
VRSYILKKSYLITAMIFITCIACTRAICSAEESQSEKPNANSKCYVCHPGMKTEEISTIHVAMGVSCDVCHGPSTEHMHDEMLMTEPDLLYGRSEVEKMCSNPSCHKPGEGREVYGWQDHKNPDAVEAFFEKWTGRIRPNGRAVSHHSVCTDCHGTHNINKPVEKTSGEQPQAEWIAAFDGSDLTGWQTLDPNNWKVQSGRIVGTAGANDKGSTLWTKEAYKNYLLAVTFRATWPVHAGIYLRGDKLVTRDSGLGTRNASDEPRATSHGRGPRIEIFDSSPAFTGSVLMPGKGLVLTNIREDLVDRESWNTISARVDGDKVQVWLNGEEIGSVKGIEPAKGKIGLFIGTRVSGLRTRKTSDKSRATSDELSVREVLIQKLAEPKEK